MRRVIVAAVLALAMCFTAGSGAVVKRNPTRPAWMPALYWAVGECETGLNPKHSTRSYEGAWGFLRSSWDAFRGRFPHDATRATLWQQYVVIRRMGLGGNGCYVNGGYRVWMGRA